MSDAGSVRQWGGVARVIIVTTEAVTYPPRSKARQAQKPKEGGEKQSAEVTDQKKKDELLMMLGGFRKNPSDLITKLKG